MAVGFWTEGHLQQVPYLCLLWRCTWEATGACFIVGKAFGPVSSLWRSAWEQQRCCHNILPDPKLSSWAREARPLDATNTMWSHQRWNSAPDYVPQLGCQFRWPLPSCYPRWSAHVAQFSCSHLYMYPMVECALPPITYRYTDFQFILWFSWTPTVHSTTSKRHPFQYARQGPPFQPLLMSTRTILPLYSALPPWPSNGTCGGCRERRMPTTTRRPTLTSGRLDCNLQRYGTMSWYTIVSVRECPSTTALESVTQSHPVSNRLSNSTSTRASKNSTSYGAGKLLTRWWGNSRITGLCGIWRSFKNLCLWRPGYGSGMYTMTRRVQMPE